MLVLKMPEALKLEVKTPDGPIEVKAWSDDTLATIKDRIAIELRRAPASFFVYALTEPVIFTEEYWATLWECMQSFGELQEASFREFMSNLEVDINLPKELPTVTRNVWMDRELPWLDDLFRSEPRMYKPLGLLEHENTRIWPFAVREPTKRQDLVGKTPFLHTSTIWIDADIAELHVVYGESFADLPVSTLYVGSTARQPLPETFASAMKQQDDAIKNIQKLLVQELPKDAIVQEGFKRLRWNQPYDTSRRLITLEQMFHAIPVSEDVPLLQYFHNRKTPSVFKMFGNEDKEVVITKTEFQRWMRISFPQQGPLLMIYRRKIPGQPLMRMSVGVGSFSWVADTDNTDSGYVFSLDTAYSLGEQLMTSIEPFFMGVKSDRRLWTWELSSWDVRISPSIGSRLTSSNVEGIMECLSPISFAQQGRGLSLVYKRTSDFGSNRDDRLWIFQKLQEGLDVDSIMSAYSRLFPVVSPEGVRTLIEDIMADNRRAFDNVVVIQSRGPWQFEMNNVRSVELFPHLLSILHSLIAIYFPDKLEDKNLVKTTCKPTKTVVVQSKQDPVDIFDFLESSESSEAAPPEPVEEPRDVVENNLSLHGIIKDRLSKRDPPRFDYKIEKGEKNARYANQCSQPVQPIVFTPTEWKNLGDNPDTKAIQEQYTGQYVFQDEVLNNVYLCPDYFCLRDEIPLQKTDLINGRCPICKGKIIPNELPAKKIKALDRREFTLFERNASMPFPKYLKKKLTPTGLRMPCCQKTSTKLNTDAMDSKKDYIMGPEKWPILDGRLGMLPYAVSDWLGLDVGAKMEADSQRLLRRGTRALLRVGMPEPVIMNTVARVMERPPSLLNGPEGVFAFARLNNGNLVRLYGTPVVNEEDAEGWKLWTAWAHETKTPLDDYVMRRVWSGHRNFLAAIDAGKPKLSHIWDLLTRDTNLQIMVMNIENDAITLRCPPLGVEPYDMNKDFLIFLERNCHFEPLGYVEKHSKVVTIQHRITPSLMRDLGLDFLLPADFAGNCRQPQAPLRLELADVEASNVREYIMDPTFKVKAVRLNTPDAFLPVYPSNLPWESMNPPTRFGYDLEDLPSALVQAKFLHDRGLGPQEYIVQNTTSPLRVLAVVTVHDIRVPVAPEPYDPKIHAPARFVSSWQANTDITLAGEPIHMVAFDQRDDLQTIRDWTLWLFSQYLHSEGEELLEALMREERGAAVKKSIKAWVKRVFRHGDGLRSKLPKFKTQEAICTLNHGQCTVDLDEDIDVDDLGAYVTYAILEDPKKRSLILRNVYPRVTSSLYELAPSEVLFTQRDVDSDRYPQHCEGNCPTKTLFDEPATKTTI